MTQSRTGIATLDDFGILLHFAHSDVNAGAAATSCLQHVSGSSAGCWWIKSVVPVSGFGETVRSNIGYGAASPWALLSIL